MLIIWNNLIMCKQMINILNKIISIETIKLWANKWAQNHLEIMLSTNY